MKSKIFTSWIVLTLSVLLINLSDLQSQEIWKEYSEKADFYLKNRDYANAQKFAEDALKECIKVWGNKDERVATLYGKLGKLFFTIGSYDQTLENYKKEKEIIESTKGKNNPAYARVINNLSVVYQLQGRNNEVEQMLLESIRIKKEVLGTKDSSYAKTLNNLAQLYQTLGRFPEAESLYLEALSIKEQELGKTDVSYGLSLYNLALLYKAMGDNSKAISSLEKATTIIENKLGESDPQTLSAYFNLSILYVNTNKVEKAKPLIDKAKKFQEMYLKDINQITANTLYNLAQNYITIKNYSEAKKILNELIGKISQKLGKGNPLYTKSLRALGIIHWIEGDYEKAFELLNETLKITEQVYDKTNLVYASALHNVAGLLKEMEEYQKAEEYYKKAFEIYRYQIDKYYPHLSEKEKRNFYTMLKEKFEMYNCFIVQRKNDNPALLCDMYDFQIETKGILINYSKKLKNIIKESNNPQLKDKYKEWKETKEYLAQLYSMSKAEIQRAKINVDSIELFSNFLEKELSQASSTISQELDTSKISWKQIQSKLKPNEAAVEIIRFKFFNKGWKDSTYYAALILTAETKQNPKIVLMENGNDMDRIFLPTYKKLIKNKFPDKKSYEVFWGKIEEQIPDKNVVYVSLDGSYNNISLNTLLKPDGSYLIDSKTIYVVPNTSEIINKDKNKIVMSTNPHATLIGFPKYKIENNSTKSGVIGYNSQADTSLVEEVAIADLPGTKIEINSINEILAKNKWSVNSYLEEEATEDLVKSLPPSDLIHIATHGFFLQDLGNGTQDRVFGVDVEKAAQNPLLRSGLLFTGASNFLNFNSQQSTNNGKENGVLSAFEAMNLNFEDTKLIVLSACETGLGEVLNGEGVYGLQRSFQVAGAKAMIMSLWTVNDEVTQELMNNFYKNWSGGQDIHTAFENAQKSIKETYKQPYYWGAFVLLGNVF